MWVSHQLKPYETFNFHQFFHNLLFFYELSLSKFFYQRMYLLCLYNDIFTSSYLSLVMSRVVADDDIDCNNVHFYVKYFSLKFYFLLCNRMNNYTIRNVPEQIQSNLVQTVRSNKIQFYYKGNDKLFYLPRHSIWLTCNLWMNEKFFFSTEKYRLRIHRVNYVYSVFGANFHRYFIHNENKKKFVTEITIIWYTIL